MDVTELRVYEESMKAFQLIKELIQHLHKELSGTRTQVLRSSKAIPALITEGFGRRRSQKEFYRFIIEAMSSSDETITHLRVIDLSKFNNLKKDDLNKMIEVYKKLSRQLNSLSRSITNRIV